MLKDEVYQSIKLRIITQDLPPCARIHEKEFVEAYHIGKTPLREVFFRLENDGLIRRFPRSGTIVAPIDFVELREVAEMRMALEKLVGELAVRNITPELLEELRARVVKLEETLHDGQIDQYILTESALHEILYRATNNRRLGQTITVQQYLFARLWFTVNRQERALVSQAEDWRRVYQAMREGDEERLVELNCNHFKFFYQFLKSMF